MADPLNPLMSDVELIERILRDHPGLTVDEVVEMAKAFGFDLDPTSTEPKRTGLDPLDPNLWIVNRPDEDLRKPERPPEAVSIRKRVWGPETKVREAWVLEYYDQAGKRRRKTFKCRRDAEKFAETTRTLLEGSAFLDNDGLDFTIHQEAVRGVPESLTVGSIISQIGEVWRANTRLSNVERAYLTAFAAATDRGLFIDDRFLEEAVRGGKTLKSYAYRFPGMPRGEDAGWIGLHRFFGMYVINFTQYGEVENTFGPFANQKDADDAFTAIVAYYTT